MGNSLLPVLMKIRPLCICRIERIPSNYCFSTSTYKRAGREHPESPDLPRLSVADYVSLGIKPEHRKKFPFDLTLFFAQQHQSLREQHHRLAYKRHLKP